MTSANVSQMTRDVSFQTNASSKQGKEESVKSEFLNLFSNASNRFGKVQKQDSSMAEVQKPQNTEISKTEYEKYSGKEDRIVQKVTGEKAVDETEATQKLEEFAEEVSQQIQDSLGITEEQLEEAMSELGLTFVNLLEPQNLAALATKLTGSEDSLSLIMNADFQGLMQSVEILGEDLMQELGVTPEELNQLVMQSQQSQSEVPEQIFAEETEMTVVVQELPEEIPEELRQNVEKTETTDVQDEEVQTTTTQQTVAVGEEEETFQEEMTDTSKDSQPEESSQEKLLAGKENVVTGSVKVERGFEAAVTKTVAVPQQQPVDTADILKQITDFTRVMYQENATTMEMQLNPEHLGKLYVQLTSKDGAVTAQLAAQNEIAKEAIESQISVLKENLNQQGVKVEAVEVTIASHEFERNLDENQQNRGEEEQKEQAAKNTRRSLNINSLDELSGLMSEEEMLAAKIMRDNGNSVDYTA